MDASTKATVDKFKDKLMSLEAQARKFKRAINRMYELEEEPIPYPDAEEEGTGLIGSPKVVRPDQYYGRPMATVAREILEERKRRDEWAIDPRDLLESMRKGGFEFEGRDDSSRLKSLTITLAKNPAFAKVPSTGHIGLADWYPGARKEKKASVAEINEFTEPTSEPEHASKSLTDAAEPKAIEQIEKSEW